MSDIILSVEEVESITGLKKPKQQLEKLLELGFFRACIPRKGWSVVVPRLHYQAILEQQANPEPEPDPDIEIDPDWMKRPERVHWRRRPEHQARVLAERAIHAEEERKEAERKVQAAANLAAYRKEQRRTRRERRAALVRFHANKRRVTKIQRTPSWANQEAIRAFYEEAIRLKRETGVEHHVDHIIPLQGELVSGLHVENNLQVLPWRENVMKRNRFEVDA